MSFVLAGIQASTGFNFGVLGSSGLMLPSSGTSLEREIGRERVDTHGHGTAKHSATRVRAVARERSGSRALNTMLVGLSSLGRYQRRLPCG